jgi:rubrerythrin
VSDRSSCRVHGDVADGEPAGVDGRLGEAQPAARGPRLTRTALLGGTLVATGGLATALPNLAGSVRSASRDVRILNYILRLEYLKAAFYEEAAAEGALSGELRQVAELLGEHERRHVELLRKRLGGDAEPSPEFDFGDATRDPDRFARTAQTVEEAAVAAYIGQGANLTRRHMVVFAQIASVEARHAAWIADILGADPAPKVADEAKTPEQVLAVIEQSGFEQGR